MFARIGLVAHRRMVTKVLKETDLVSFIRNVA